MVWAIIGGVILLLILLVFVVQLPDLRRYLKMRSM